MRWTAMVMPAVAFAAALRLYPLLDGHAWGPLGQLSAGLLMSALVLALVAWLRHRERLSWDIIGHLSAGRNLRAFAMGAGLWLLPAAIGTAVCVALGWSSISFRAPPAQVLAALPLLALTVLLVEALPEEFAIRGWAQGLAARRYPQWAALLLQAALFVAMAWLAGAMQSAGQWMFLPGFALILGYARALTGSVWTSIGVHFAWMTTSQLINGHAWVEGMAMLQFVAFALLPSATLGAVLGMMRPDFRWTELRSP